MAEDFMLLHPGVKIDVTGTGTGTGIAGLIERKYQLSMISRPLAEEELNAGLWVIPVAKEGVAPIVNQKNPVIDILMDQGLSPDEFLKIFTSGSLLTWGQVLSMDQREKIHPFTRSDESGAAEIWAGFIFRTRHDLQGKLVSSDQEMIKAVRNDPLAIGYCNLSYAFDTAGQRISDIQIIPVDLDFDNKIERKEEPFATLEAAHRSLWLGYYPRSLCRELTIGSMGKPADPVILEFLKYVLGEGQKLVKEAGFCELNNVYIRQSLESLK